MQAEATAPTPPNSQARRASPTTADDAAEAGRFGAALKAAQGREEARANDQAPNGPEPRGTEAWRGAAPGTAPPRGEDSPPTLGTTQPADAPPLAEAPSAIPETEDTAEGTADAPQAMLPLVTAETVTVAPTLPIIAPPIQPTAALPAATTTPGSATPAATPAPPAPVTTEAATTETATTVTATPTRPQDPPAPPPRDGLEPATGEAAPAGQAMPRPDGLRPVAPAPSLATPTAPPVAVASSAPAAPQPNGVAAAPATEAATAGTAPPGLLATAAAPTTRSTKPPPIPTGPGVQAASAVDQAPASPGVAAESSAPAPATPIPAQAGIAARAADGGDPWFLATGTVFDAATSQAAAPGPGLPETPEAPESQDGATGAAATATAPDTASAPPATPPPLTNASADRPVRPPRQTPAGQIVPIAIALSLGSEARGSITVSLDPIELGRVDVRVERMGDTATVQVVAERPETLLLLQRDQATLDRALADAGIGGGGRSLSFSLGGDGRGGQDRARRPTAALPEFTDSPAHAADQRGAGRPRALLDIAV